MSYEKFKSRQWKVKEPAGILAQCVPGDVVTFRGPEKKVQVFCKGEPTYDEGMYKAISHTIVRANEYTISMDEPNGTITFDLNDDSITGSWTAEDHGPWQGDG